MSLSLSINRNRWQSVDVLERKKAKAFFDDAQYIVSNWCAQSQKPLFVNPV